MSRLLASELLNSVSCIDDAPGGGVLSDPYAPRNAPALDPASYLDKVLFHSDFDYFEVFSGPETITVNHALVAGYTSADMGIDGISIYLLGQVVETDHVLATHNLGYPPKFMVALDGARISTGTLINHGTTPSNPQARYVSAYATNTQIILHEIAASNASDLAAISKDYEVMVFKTPQEVPGTHIADMSGDRVQLGRGKVDSANRYARKVLAGESSFDFNLGSTGHLTNGRLRVVSGGNVYDEPGYDGSFAGPAYAPVGGFD